MEESTFIIIGGGIAGVSCAEILGYLCPNKSVTLVSASDYVKAVTNVIPLTKMLAKFDVVEKNAGSFAETQPSLKVIIDSVVGINSTEHTITTNSNGKLNYKVLCVCSGGVPKLISSDDEFIIGIRDTESVKSFQKRTESARRILVVGNGGIATELVFELADVEIIWVVKDDHISAPFIDAGAAEFLLRTILNSDKSEKPTDMSRKVYRVSGETDQKSKIGAALGPNWHNGFDLKGNLECSGKYNINIEYKCEVKRVLNSKNKQFTKPNKSGDGENWPVTVELTNGKIYGCDLIVSATGVIPNTTYEFEDGLCFDLATDGGIKVDHNMKTNLKDVYAAGDVCTPVWEYEPHWFQMRLWTQAHQMGCYAAKSMSAYLKNETTFQDICFELFTHVTNFFGFKVVLLGLFNGQKLGNDYNCQVRITPNSEYVKLVFKNGKLQGAVLIGDTDLEEMCENLILNQLNLTDIENDLLRPDIDIEDYFD